jgi:putative membrane protein insertion efficiency factor
VKSEALDGVPHSALALSRSTNEDVPTELVHAQVRGSGKIFLSPGAHVLICAILFYRAVIPDRLKPKCIYRPTCSQYAIEALRSFGLIKGIRVSLERLNRCNGALYLPRQDPL